MTPSEIAALAACFRCIVDRQSAILFLLATIANVTLAEIIAGSACYRCVTDFSAAQLFLLNQIVTNGTGGGGGTAAADQVACGAADPVAAPTGACSWYINTTSGATFYWNGAAWIFKV